MMNTNISNLGSSYSLTIVTCGLEKLILEVRVRSPLTRYQNCPTVLFYKKNYLGVYNHIKLYVVFFLFKCFLRRLSHAHCLKKYL